MLEYINDMKMEQDHEIMKSDKLEYNALLVRIKTYSSLSEELQQQYSEEFAKLVEKMDKLISEMGVDNAATEEWQNGFIIEEGSV